MLGIPLFRKSAISADCEQCKRRFDPAEGGLCDVCQRILCPDHLHGSWFRRMRVDLGGRAVCTECRAQGRGS
jgi:hypothetical protein